MSVTNPLVKELKGWTRKFTEFGGYIDDKNPDLVEFCICLERCFQKGVSMLINVVGFPKMPETWYWLEELAHKNERSLLTFYSVVELVRESDKVQSSVGKLRLFIRVALTRKCLHIPVQTLVRTPGLASEYYDSNSILGDEILGEIFLSVLLQISRLNFRLDPRNASFLDETWLLPEYKFFELVPCKSLGISICFINGKALIVHLQENSVAAEDEKIEVCDVLDEINGNVITSTTQGRLQKIIRKSSGLPIYLHIIKARYKDSQEYYGPITTLCKRSGLKHIIRMIQSPKPISKENEKPSTARKDLSKSLNSGYSVIYCGQVSTGNEGDVKQIEKAMWRLLNSGNSTKIPVRFETLEIGIRVIRESDESVILQPSYMEISSCGRTAKIPDYFAFIAGETNCNVAKNFTAHVFRHQRESEVQTILQSLGQGFHRTHFAV
ncbi:uncharacterized protein [Venturia canescens]|uniref:uncharacterized protein n=1 Tax=Venturia canescens TaxID=32260 RepID=UPI001C9C8DB6|nr:uncharacterized protein LOC122410417 [Venturia canescens]